MGTKVSKTNKVVSLLLIAVMTMTMVFPMSVFALPDAPVAVATVVENSDGTQTKTITLSFEEEIILEATAMLDGNITVTDKKFGASMMDVDGTGKKLVITLADDSNVAVGDSITFGSDAVKNSADEFFSGDVDITA